VDRQYAPRPSRAPSRGPSRARNFLRSFRGMHRCRCPRKGGIGRGKLGSAHPGYETERGTPPAAWDRTREVGIGPPGLRDRARDASRCMASARVGVPDLGGGGAARRHDATGRPCLRCGACQTPEDEAKHEENERATANERPRAQNPSHETQPARMATTSTPKRKFEEITADTLLGSHCVRT